MKIIKVTFLSAPIMGILKISEKISSGPQKVRHSRSLYYTEYIISFTVLNVKIHNNENLFRSLDAYIP